MAFVAALTCGGNIATLSSTINSATTTIRIILLANIIINMIFTIAPVIFLSLYAYFMLSIRERFNSINSASEHILGSLYATSWLHNAETGQFIVFFNRLAVLHDHMNDNLDWISECYSFQVRQTQFAPLKLSYALTNLYSIEQMWMYVSYGFLACVLSSFSMYLNFTSTMNFEITEYVLHIFTSSSWVLYCIFNLLVLFHVTHVTFVEVSINYTKP